MWVGHSHAHQAVVKIHDYLEDINPGLSRKVFGGVITSAAVSYVAVRGYRYYRARRTVKERGEAAKLACHVLREHLEQEGPVDPQKEAMITDLELSELKQKLWKGELKALEVLRAYQRKALQVDEKLNCVTEPIFEAEALAVELDLLSPNQRKPLHGIPVSVKDSFNVEGYDCHAGFSCFADKPVERDGDIVQIFKSLGAVPFVRTNFPQGLMTFACSNPMYGATKNPHSLTRGPGGSSGGEGSLIGGGGSVVGIGSDIGGSIRIPCQMCGVYGLKPTVDRISNQGHIPLMSGQNLVRMTAGPMARDMDGLILVTEALLTPRMHQLDPYVPPLFFQDTLYEKKSPLVVGFYTAIDGVHSHPTCVRAVMEAKTALTQQGHKVIEFQPPRAVEAVSNLFMKACFGDDGEETALYLKDDVLDRSVTFSYYMGKLPKRLRYMVSRLIGFMDPPLGQLVVGASTPPRKILEWWYLQDKIQAYKREFFAAWQSRKLDALICPGMPFPAVTAGTEDNVLGLFVFFLKLPQTGAVALW
ncbi:vitamin D3 hydroxylase-associated protein-like isoform X2 [Littorina saxatilis]|uniref:vitamin D3 hydroxylase-associated protein-like isoform X2 n=1 Tax=Littorina saxatilis TaxID=31220 RepID=UPI0038B507B2